MSAKGTYGPACTGHTDLARQQRAEFVAQHGIVQGSATRTHLQRAAVTRVLARNELR